MTAHPPQPPQPGRRHAARHLLTPHLIRASMALAQQPALAVSALTGLQAALVAAIALPFFYLSPFANLIGFASLGALVALFGRFAAPRRRGRVLLLAGLCQASAVFATSLAAWAGLPLAVQFVLLALLCGAYFLAATGGDFGPPGALIFVFAAGAGMAPPADLNEVLARSAATGSVALLSWALCVASEAWRRHPAPAKTAPPPQPRPWPELRLATLRITLGSGLAIAASHGLGVPHPVWAAMGAIAVMQGPFLHINMHRALQRMAGTMVGALVAWVFLNAEPSAWVVIATLAALQFLTELIIGANYGLGQILVTPMALLMVHLASLGRAGPELAPERVVDTLLGAAIGIVLAVLLSSPDERRQLARAASPG